jgi:hypothetical protein
VWDLVTRASARAVQAPLTAAGTARFAGVLAADITITGTLPHGNTTASVTYYVLDTARKTIVGHVVLPDAAKQNNSVALNFKVPSADAPYAIGTFDEKGDFQPAGFLTISQGVGDQRPSGAEGAR